MDYHLEEKDQRLLVSLITAMEISTVKSLDYMEQAVRELVQLVGLLAPEFPSWYINTQIGRNLHGFQKMRQPVSSDGAKFGTKYGIGREINHL